MGHRHFCGDGLEWGLSHGMGDGMKHVVVLVGANDRFEGSNYYLCHLVRQWRRQGVMVTVQHGPGAVVHADLAVQHVDQTKVEPAYRAWLKHYPKAVNRGISDISKRHISQQRVLPGDGWTGPVIVKTDRNAGGHKDRRSSTPGLKRWLMDRLDPWLPLRWRGTLTSSQYPIFDSAQKVPAGVWHNPALMVERLLCERKGKRYALRTWSFLGDAELSSVSYGERPVVKGDQVLGREDGVPVPAALRELRAKMGFDYGRFDYALVDGELVLYDTNATPTLGRVPWAQAEARVGPMAQGLAGLF